MDYLTRRHAAIAGHRCRHLGGDGRFPCIAAIGIRIERDGTVAWREIDQAAADLGLRVDLPPGERLPAATIEPLVAPHGTPELLGAKMRGFLDGLAAAARGPGILSGDNYAAIEREATARGCGVNALIREVAELLRTNPDLIPGRPDTRQPKTIPAEVLDAGLELYRTEEGLQSWLNMPARWANGLTPWQLIDAGREADVLGAIRGLLAGNFL